MSNPSPHFEQHTMQLVTTHPSGAEEWLCPTCGRRLLMQWRPDYNRVVLETGDEHALHSGSKGGLQIGSVGISEGEEPDVSAELRAAIEEALDDIDFDDWPDESAPGK